MTLPYDVTRCEGDWCPHRANCARYLAFVEDEFCLDVGAQVSVAMHLCDADNDFQIVVESDSIA